MRKSKYLGKQFGNWTCTHVGINNVQGKRAAAPGKINYYYIFERITSDNLAEKLIRLNSSDAAKVYRGELQVEEIAEKRRSQTEEKFNRKISYHFVR